MISLNRFYLKLFYFLLFMSSVGGVYFLAVESIAITACYFFIFVVFNFLGYFVFNKISSIFIKTNFLFFYVGYLLAMPVIFIQKSRFTRYGWSGIGNYSFGANKTFEALSIITLYTVVFVIISIIFDKLILKKYYFLETEKSAINFSILKSFRKFRFFFAGILLFQLYLSFFMFTHKIGIVGVIPDELPFRLVGILYYYRYFIIPLVSMVLLFSNIGHRVRVYIFIIVLEALVSGILGVSKSVLVFHLIPVVFYLIYVKKGSYNIIIAAVAILGASIASISRDLVYFTSSLNEINFWDLLIYATNDEKFGADFVGKMLGAMVARIGGYQEFFAAYFSNIDYVDTNLFFNSVLGFESFNYGSFEISTDIFGFQLPEGFAFGMSLDPFSYLYLSSMNLLDVIFLIVTWIFLLVIIEKLINIALSKYRQSVFFIAGMNIYVLFSLVNPNIKMVFFQLPLLLLPFILIGGLKMRGRIEESG